MRDMTRAIVEGVGALFGLPVSDGKSRRFRFLVLAVILSSLMAVVALAIIVENGRT